MLAGAWLLTIGGLSHAADMPIKAPPIVPVYNWTGFYLGANVGGGEAKSGWCTNATVGVNGCVDGDIVSHSNTSFTIGGQFGYRYQLGNLVFGAEGAIDLFNNTVTSPAALPALPNRVRTTSFDDLYSVTGQLGYAAGNVLFYGKGGWAGANIGYDANSANIGGFDLAASANAEGYTAGAGIDYLVTPNFVIGIEYDYYKFSVGAFKGLVNTGGVVIPCSFCNITETVQTVRVKASLKF
jgi:outer membrane immunogenic protein